MRPRIDSRRVLEDDKRAFQNHIRQGLEAFGLLQKDLRRSTYHPEIKTRAQQWAAELQAKRDWSWVRTHLKETDAYFTYDIARELFNAVVRHPEAASSKNARKLQEWVFEAYSMRALRPELGIGCFVPPEATADLANAIADYVIRNSTTSQKKRMELSAAVADYFKNEGQQLAQVFALRYGTRLYDLHGESLTTPFDVLNQAVYYAWDTSLMTNEINSNAS